MSGKLESDLLVPGRHLNHDVKFQELIPDPVAVAFYRDKVIVLTASGAIIGRGLAPLEEQEPEYDDMPPGMGV